MEAGDPDVLFGRIDPGHLGAEAGQGLGQQSAAAAVTGFDATYMEIVDNLLTSPTHGEHWAQHWLDVARFAETNGFEMNQPRPNAWPYRDYVIAAFNDDKPYDQFIAEQLAGDALGDSLYEAKLFVVVIEIFEYPVALFFRRTLAVIKFTVARLISAIVVEAIEV